MPRRWLLAVAVVAAAAIGAVILFRGGDAKAPAPAPAAAPSARAPAPGAIHRQPVQPRVGVRDPDDGRHYVNGVDPSDPSPGVKKWKEDGLPGTFREFTAPDDSENAEEKMTYRVRRLRFDLTDAAAACYDGGDGKLSMALDYTMVVKDHELVTEDVRVAGSNLGDKQLEDCIVTAIKNLRAPAPDVPDMRRPQGTTISQHDLWVRNRSAD
ncbi:MAG: hypothetical protein H6709_16165 [Kofleriaceae bacterium]|nr:hypothetical protein [Kofleriaceae bacterium]